MTRGAIILATLLWPGSAVAADLWLDGDASQCPGEGSAETPFCDLDSAAAVAGPGDNIYVRQTQQPYAELALSANVAVSGTAELPIRLAAAEGESPVLSGEIKLSNLSYWIVEGFTVVGSSDRGIEVRSPETESRGVVIRNNRIFDAAARGIKSGVPGEDAALTHGTIIENNYIYGATTAGIEVAVGAGIIVRDNIVEDTNCLLEGAFPQHGIVVIGSATDVEVAGNVVRLGAECTFEQNRAVGIDIRGSVGGTVSKNLVEVIGSSAATFVGGISLRNDASNWQVTGNLIRDTSGCGLCDGVDATGSAGTSWMHNTVVNTEVGISAGLSTGAVFQSNLVVATQTAVMLGEGVGALVSRNNVFFAPGQSPFRSSDGEMVGFEGWGAACECDEGSYFAEPQFAPDGLTPAASPALDGATASMRVAAGAAADVGALEAPLFVGGSVSEDGQRVFAFFDVAHPPLTPAGCEGVRVLREGVVMGLVDCTFDGDMMTISLPSSLYAGQDAALEVVALFDAADVGGLGAMMEPTRVTLDTADLPPAPDAQSDTDTGTGTDSGSGSGTGTGTGTDSGTDPGTDAGTGEPVASTPPAESGCGCGPRNRSGWAFLAVLLVFFVKRPVCED